MPVACGTRFLINPMLSNATVRPLNHAWKLRLTPLTPKNFRLRRALRPVKFSKNPLKPLLSETTPPPRGRVIVTARATSQPCFLSGLTPMCYTPLRGVLNTPSLYKGKSLNQCNCKDFAKFVKLNCIGTHFYILYKY
jgi:hypothetical protein